MSFQMTLMSDLESHSQIFSDTKHRVVSLRQLSFLLSQIVACLYFVHSQWFLWRSMTVS